MPDRAPTDLPALLAAFKAKVITDNVFPNPRHVVVTLNADPDTARPPADRFLSLLPQSAKADLGLTAGGGRPALSFDGVLEASLWQRMPSDVFGSDEDYLLDSNRGFFTTFVGVVSSLEQYDPISAAGAGDYLLSQPLRCTGFRPAPRRGGAEFARVVLEFALAFQFRLPTVPLPVAPNPGP